MPVGPGKYDDECTLVREATCADAVIMMIVGGVRGSGFSVQAVEAVDGFELARILETMATEIRLSYQELVKQ